MCEDGKCGREPAKKLVDGLETVSAGVVIETLKDAGVPFKYSTSVLARAIAVVALEKSAEGGVTDADVQAEADKAKALIDQYVGEYKESFRDFNAATKGRKPSSFDPAFASL